VWSEAEHAIAQSFSTLAAVHHLVIVVVGVIFWVRRRDMERTVAVYFTLAFATSTVALATAPPTRVAAFVAVGLVALWVREVVRGTNDLSLRRAPKFRLVAMALLGAYAFGYPGYSHVLPTFVTSPLGVTLQPTVMLALALMNAAAPDTDRALHWSLVGVGAVLGIAGLFADGWIHAPLLVTALYGVPLLLGRANVTEERSETDATSVRAVHDRMHKRRVLMSRPRRSAVRKLDVRKRRD
jgi:hypothetical protein